MLCEQAHKISVTKLYRDRKQYRSYLKDAFQLSIDIRSNLTRPGIQNPGPVAQDHVHINCRRSWICSTRSCTLFEDHE